MVANSVFLFNATNYLGMSNNSNDNNTVPLFVLSFAENS